MPKNQVNRCFSAALCMTLMCATGFIIAGCNKTEKTEQPTTPNTLGSSEAEQGFKRLFDGKSLDHFKAASKEAIPSRWVVKDGQIICMPRDPQSRGVRGSIVTKKQYANFDFRFQYKIDPDLKKGANSGVKYFSYPNTELGLEYQLLDHDAETRQTHALGDLYDLLAATERPANPRGHWNDVRIVARDTTVQHWLNGRKILEYQRGSASFRAAVATSKFKNRDRFGEAKQGPILLQDHGGGFAFRNLRIKTLTAENEKKQSQDHRKERKS